MPSVEPGIVHSVSEINTLVRELVESSYGHIAVEGEVSNFRRHSSGHLYFRLKDEDATLNTVCFRGSARRLRVELADGLKVIAFGRLTVYEVQGQYQLVADMIEPSGVGELERAFRELVSRLEGEGLFAPEHKQALPRFPQSIGVVTSPTGAAVRDIISTLQRRWPCADILLVPVRVQGDLAAPEIVDAIARLSRMREPVDVVIVGRGGGSLEDLWAFNEEAVARAIHACPIPVVSAVGHETDVTIADLVADARAATPTMAAEIAAPRRNDVHATVRSYENRLGVLGATRIELARRRVNALLGSYALGQVRGRIENAMQSLDYVSERTVRATQARLLDARTSSTSLLARMQGLDPHAILGRGYAYCATPDSGRVIRNVADAHNAGAMRVTFHDGSVRANVEENNS